jgi:hypothetical protein
MTTIHTFIMASLEWPCPSEHLPFTNNCVCISGELLTVKNEEAFIILEKLEIAFT